MAEMALLPTLSEAEVAGFFERGFIRLPSLFSAEECARLRGNVMARCAQLPPNWQAAAPDRNGHVGGRAVGATGHAAGQVLPAGSYGRLQASIRYEPKTAGVDVQNPNGLLFVQGTNLLRS